MNILHMKYAVEVARLGSLNKAAEALFVAQPNISRSIKGLEAELGIEIFNRSAKGMVLTPQGEEFIGYAKHILKQIEDVELLYKNGVQKKQHFRISAPRASYISEAFARFSTGISSDFSEIVFKETSSKTTIEDILNNECQLGIVRYSKEYDRLFKELFDEKGLSYEMVSEFSCLLLMNKNHPLASKKAIYSEDTLKYTEAVFADPSVSILPFAKTMKNDLQFTGEKQIFIYERASLFDLLSENNELFIWVSPVSSKLLERYGLVQRRCEDNTAVYKDVLIYRSEHRFSEPEKAFITELCNSKRRIIG